MAHDGWMGGWWALRRLAGATMAGLGGSGASMGMGVHAGTRGNAPWARCELGGTCQGLVIAGSAWDRRAGQVQQIGACLGGIEVGGGWDDWRAPCARH